MKIRYDNINEVLYAVARELNLHSTSEIRYFKANEKMLLPCGEGMRQLLELENGASFSVVTRELEGDIKYELERSTYDSACVPHPPIVAGPLILPYLSVNEVASRTLKLDNNVIVYW